MERLDLRQLGTIFGQKIFVDLSDVKGDEEWKEHKLLVIQKCIADAFQADSGVDEE